MSKKTWILISCLVLSLTLGLGGSLAYLTDTDTKINTFTMGNVDIEVEEKFDQEKADSMKPGVEIQKEAWIHNTGANDAYVWMTVAIPEDIDDYIIKNWNQDDEYNALLGFPREVDAEGNEIPEAGYDWYYTAQGEDGKIYRVYTQLVFNPVPANQGDDSKTEQLLYSVTLNDFVDIVDGRYYWIEDGVMTEIPFNEEGMNIIVTGYAMQTDGINDVFRAYELYNQQWGDQQVPNIDSDDKNTWMVHSTEELQDLLKNDPNNKVITLASGTYEHVTLGDVENLIIRAAVGADPVVKGITIDDQTDGLKVSNLTIQGITFEGDGINFTFGDGSPWDLVEGLEVDNCRLYASKAENGAGLVDVHASSPGSNRMFDVIINNCHVNNAGWGVRLGAINNKATITNCLFENIYNNAVSLRGSSQADIVIKDNEIRNLSTRAFRIDNVLSGTVTYSNNIIENAIDLEDNSVLKFNGIADGASIVYEGTTYAGPMDKTAIQ